MRKLTCREVQSVSQVPKVRIKYLSYKLLCIQKWVLLDKTHGDCRYIQEHCAVYTPFPFSHCQNQMEWKLKVIIKIRWNGLRQCSIIFYRETKYFVIQRTCCLGSKVRENPQTNPVRPGRLGLWLLSIISPSEDPLPLSIHFLQTSTHSWRAQLKSHILYQAFLNNPRHR